MKLNKPRIPPLADNELNDHQKAVLEGRQMRGNISNVFRTLIHHPNLAKHFMVFGAHILSKNSLTPREREIAILRAGYLAGSEYEWGSHVIIGRNAGLSDEEIEAIKAGPDSGSWCDADRLVLKVADELHNHVFISDETWAALTEHYSTEQVLDLIFTCGQYRMLAGALNSLGVPLDEGVKGF